MSDMIERAAIAIFKIEQPDRDYISLNQFGKEYYQSLAKAAIEAMREPTEAMMDRATDFDWGPGIHGDETEASPGRVWCAMIDAALNEKSPATP